MKKAKWLIYTVVIGLIPFFIRSFIALFDKAGSISYWINEGDFIVFGLVLNLTNINELEDRQFDDKIWKTKNIGLSVIFIIIFSAIFAIASYSDFKNNQDLNKSIVKLSSILLSVMTFIFSYSIFNRLNAIEK
jgi:uncharacterized membrane protein